MTLLTKHQTARSPQGMGPQHATDVVDVVIMPGLSVHFYGKSVGIYCSRIHAGRGFVEMPLRDLQAVVEHFRDQEAQDPLNDGRRP